MSAAQFIARMLLDMSGHTLARYRPMFMLMELQLLAIAFFFMVATALDPSLFSATTWGDYAYTFPARMWASLLALAAFTTFWGLVRPPARRMIALGLTLHVINYSALAASAAFTGGDVAVALYAAFFAGVHTVLAWLTTKRGPYALTD